MRPFHHSFLVSHILCGNNLCTALKTTRSFRAATVRSCEKIKRSHRRDAENAEIAENKCCKYNSCFFLCELCGSAVSFFTASERAGAVRREEKRPLADARGSEHPVDLRLKVKPRDVE